MYLHFDDICNVNDWIIIKKTLEETFVLLYASCRSFHKGHWFKEASSKDEKDNRSENVILLFNLCIFIE